MLPQLINTLLTAGEHTDVTDLSDLELRTVSVPLAESDVIEHFENAASYEWVTELDTCTVYTLPDGFAIVVEDSAGDKHIAVSHGSPSMDVVSKFLDGCPDADESEVCDLLAYLKTL